MFGFKGALVRPRKGPFISATKPLKGISHSDSKIPKMKKEDKDFSSLRGLDALSFSPSTDGGSDEASVTDTSSMTGRLLLIIPTTSRNSYPKISFLYIYFFHE